MCIVSNSKRQTQHCYPLVNSVLFLAYQTMFSKRNIVTLFHKGNIDKWMLLLSRSWTLVWTWIYHYIYKLYTMPSAVLFLFFGWQLWFVCICHLRQLHLVIMELYTKIYWNSFKIGLIFGEVYQINGQLFGVLSGNSRKLFFDLCVYSCL